jgi:hypothetical protein
MAKLQPVPIAIRRRNSTQLLSVVLSPAVNSHTKPGHPIDEGFMKEIGNCYWFITMQQPDRSPLHANSGFKGQGFYLETSFIDEMPECLWSTRETGDLPSCNTSGDGVGRHSHIYDWVAWLSLLPKSMHA